MLCKSDAEVKKGVEEAARDVLGMEGLELEEVQDEINEGSGHEMDHQNHGEITSME